MAAYLVDDETWAAALLEAEATYEPVKSLTPLAEAVRKAQGKQPTENEIKESIGFLNQVSAAMRGRKP
jgi:hypothetical protein